MSSRTYRDYLHSVAMQGHNNETFFFSRLPREVRNSIYTAIFRNEHYTLQRNAPEHERESHRKQASIRYALQVCRQFREEANPIFHSTLVPLVVQSVDRRFHLVKELQTPIFDIDRLKHIHYVTDQDLDKDVGKVMSAVCYMDSLDRLDISIAHSPAEQNAVLEENVWLNHWLGIRTTRQKMFASKVTVIRDWLGFHAIDLLLDTIHGLSGKKPVVVLRDEIKIREATGGFEKDGKTQLIWSDCGVSFSVPSAL